PGARGAGGDADAWGGMGGHIGAPHVKMTSLFEAPLRVVSIGLDIFARELDRGGVGQVHVDWRPPAGGDHRMAALLARLGPRRAEIEGANATALTRLVEGDPVLVDCRPARDAIGLPERTVLHAGPPLAWARMCPPLQAAVLCA